MPTDFLVARFRPDGRIDQTFATNGVLRIPSAIAGVPTAAHAVEAGRGSITVAGASTVGGAANLALIKLDDRGMLKAGFGSGGVKRSPFFSGKTATRIDAIAFDRPVVLVDSSPGVARSAAGAGRRVLSAISTLLGRPDQFLLGGTRIVVAGATQGPAGPAFAVARYTPLGVPDTTFSGDGEVRLTFSDGIGGALAVATDRQRRVLVAGEVRGVLPGNRTGGLVRLSPNGGIDQTFGNGFVLLAFTFNNSVGDLDVADLVVNGRGDVSLAALGVRDPSVTNSSYLAIRLTHEGLFDRSFDGDGLAETSFTAPVRPYSIVGDRRTRLMVVGEGAGGMGIVRYLPNGRRDTTFGNAGRVTIAITGRSDIARTAIVDTGERTVVAGSAGQALALARVREDGSLDSGFGTGGMVRMEIAGTDFGVAEAVALDEAGRIVVAGRTGTNDVD